MQNDDNTFFEAFMEWRFAIMQNMNSGYRSHDCSIVKTEVESFSAEDFYESFCNRMEAMPEMMSAESTEENLSNKLDILIAELEMLRQEMDEVTQEQIGRESVVEESIPYAAAGCLIGKP